MHYKTQSAHPQTIPEEWLWVDAAGQRLGRLMSQVAFLIRGKHKPSFTPHVNSKVKVIVINARHVCLAGKRWDNKQYLSHTGYPGGQRSVTPKVLKEKCPTRIIEHALQGMLPKNRLGRALFRNLFVYADSTHQHAAQQPQEMKLKY